MALPAFPRPPPPPLPSPLSPKTPALPPPGHPPFFPRLYARPRLGIARPPPVGGAGPRIGQRVLRGRRVRPGRGPPHAHRGARPARRSEGADGTGGVQRPVPPTVRGAARHHGRLDPAGLRRRRYRGAAVPRLVRGATSRARVP